MRLRILIGLMITLFAFPLVLNAKKAKAVRDLKKPTETVSTVKVQKQADEVQSKNTKTIISPFQAPVKNTSRDFDQNEARVYKMNGTIMVQHADGADPAALGSFDTVKKGDTITVYDKSWVILKTRRGDKIGLDGNTVLAIDEYYFGGPDRQVRVVLQKGSLFLKTNNVGSRQSFFEINTGGVVTSVGDSSAIFEYDKAKDSLKLQYMRGKLKVIDKNEEQKFAYENTIHNWEAGAMKETEAVPMDELDGINFKKFLEGEKRLPPTDANILLKTGG
jgi:hypothetical protein